MTLTVGSLFSGAGGFDLGFEQAGFRIAWQCENDPHARCVLRRHWPDVPLYGDIREVDGAQLEPVDVVIFGSPCTDLSLAGKRAGLRGAASGLYWEAIRIIRECRPAWALWENVAGALSSNGGRDFGAALDALADSGALAVGWRLLDAQYFGVAQRRRRVFALAGFRDGADLGAVLFEPESVRGDTAAGRAAREDVAGAITASAGHHGRSSPRGDGSDTLIASTIRAGDRNARPDGSDNQVVGAQWTQETAGTLGSNFSSKHRDDLDSCGAYVVSAAVSAKWAKGTGGPSGDEVLNLIAFDNHDGTASEQAATLRATEHGALPMVMGFSVRSFEVTGERTNSLAAGTGATGNLIPGAFTRNQVRRLTPRECERLQGWPDDHTRYAADGTALADSHRYRLIGNGVASPVAAWIARRLTEVL